MIFHTFPSKISPNCGQASTIPRGQAESQGEDRGSGIKDPLILSVLFFSPCFPIGLDFWWLDYIGFLVSVKCCEFEF